MCAPKKQPVQQITNNTTTTAPTPPPQAMAQSAQAAQGAAALPEEASRDEGGSIARARRKGRSGLRIRLDAGNTGGGTGLNIPRA